MTHVMPTVVLCASLASTTASGRSWPPHEFLLRSLLNAVPKLLDTYHPETGRFGTEPWVYQDQMSIYPLAAAWSLDEPGNPYYHDPKLIEVIARGGEVWFEQQGEDGTWQLLRKNGDDWGRFRSSFVESHWVTTYHLVRDVLPEESRSKWETGLTRCLKHVPGMLAKASVHNQPLRHALALYIGGVCFENEEWKRAASAYMAKTAAAQDPAGFWSEHSGPAVAYSMAYPWFLGIYYHFSEDATVLEALQKASRFHLLTRWPDGSLIACIDERTLYTKAVRLGDVGFSFCPEGRALLFAQLDIKTCNLEQDASAEYAANMLLFGGEGEAAELPETRSGTVVAVGARDTLIAHRQPWHWAFAGYTCELSKSRWTQDRQNLVDVFHDKLGLVVGGGNTKLQPYWSTFTVGNPAQLRITPGEEKPNFVPDIDLSWTPESATLSEHAGATCMDLAYAGVNCRVRAEIDGTGAFRLTFSAPAGKRVEAHLPFLSRSKRVRLGSGEDIVLTKEELLLNCARIGSWFVLDRLKVSVPEGAMLRWPAWQHNPYRKDGSSSTGSAKLVLMMPFDTAEEHSVTLTYDSGT